MVRVDSRCGLNATGIVTLTLTLTLTLTDDRPLQMDIFL